MFDRDLEQFSNNIAFIDTKGNISYLQLSQKIKKFEEQLPDTKQLIAIEMTSTLESIVAYLSCLKNEHPVLMVDPVIKDDKKNIIYEKYKPNFIFKQDKLLSFYSKKHNLYEKLALLLPTSGSTGSTKYVRLSKKNIYANTQAICEYLPLSHTDRTITNLPLHYSYALSILHTYLNVGASIVLSSEPITSKEFWDIFEKMECSNFNGVPFHYEILSRLRITKKTFPKLHFLTQAGGKLNQRYVVEFAKWAKEQNKQFFIMYGQTEATARISYLSADKTLLKPSSIGGAIPNGKLSLLNRELIYQGDNVMLGYATSLEDLTQGDLLHSILHTGDLANKDEDGDFYIVGRLKRFIKLYGHRVNLDEIEQSFKTNKFDVVVVGKDDAITVFTKDDLQNLKNFIALEFRSYKRVIKIQQIDHFIVKSNGKIDYLKMLELVNDR